MNTKKKPRFFIYMPEDEDCYYWIDAQYIKHRISDMSEQYLQNCLKFMEKKGNRKWEIKILAQECRHRQKIKKTEIGKMLYS